jgi:hypothetical protein
MTTLPTVRIEGGLLGPDILEQLLAGDLPGQRAADFGLDARRSLTDEIAALFADARTLWGVFQNRLQRLAPDDPATSVTRDAWMIPFLGLLGYELRYNPRAYEVDGMSFAVSHRAGSDEDAPPLHIVGVRQELGRVPASGRPRLAPHSLLQEYLNRTEQVWGIVTNGATLRLLRDSTYVRRQAYVEFDLQTMIEEQRFQDFAALFRLLHRSRLPQHAADADACLLERYYSQSVEQGGRVREHLREGVEACLVQLANGFLQHPANDDLRRRCDPARGGHAALRAGDFYRQLLRLVCRLLFLLVAEDRGLLSADPLYREHYGVARLRRLLDRRAAYTAHDDLWQSLRVLWRVLGDETLAELLHLAPLNGELFAPQTLDSFTITNRELLEAFRQLTWYQERPTRPPRRVNYAALDVEELGSVYESLLEFHPALDFDAQGRPTFSLIFGSERKTTGSYYTPPQLVHELIESALAPVIRARGAKNEQALLAIRICDPACGSGHFLLAAARRLGKELARLRSGEDEPAPEAVRAATRTVIGHCIYGVDRNPLAVDLCRVALWLESHTGDKPLTFLDHRIRCGDSLVGVFDLDALDAGIPDKAFEPLEGDDKPTARELAQRNRRERAGSRTLFSVTVEAALTDFSRQSRAVDAVEDDSPAAVRRKRDLYAQVQADPAWQRQKLACDLWTAAFFQPLQPGAPAITTAALQDQRAGQPVDARLAGQAAALAQAHAFFHWPLEFPEVFAAGGFDVILSNPPWERVKLQEQEFFAARDARIAAAPTKAVRGRLIRDLPQENPALYAEYAAALRAAAATSAILRNGGRFPLTGRGDINTYAVFAELCRSLLRPQGRAGVIVPSGIATDDTTKFFFQSIMQTQTLVSLFDFENRSGIFPAVHKSYKFCLLTLAGAAPREKAAADFIFFALGVDDLRQPEKRFSLTAAEIALLNPNTGNCPIFRSQADAELTKAIYRRVPILWREAAAERPEENPWRLSFSRLFDMSNDSHHFRTAAELAADGYRRQGNVFVSPYDRYLPLYEAKMVHQFDHRWATYGGDGSEASEVRDVTAAEKRDPAFVVQPRYWVREAVVESAIPRYPAPLALALQIDHRASIQRVLCWWLAGAYQLAGAADAAAHWLHRAVRYQPEAAVARALGEGRDRELALTLARDFALAPADLPAIAAALDAPETLAASLVERFSPQWFLGHRGIGRSTDERTIIASALPKSAVGNSSPLLFMEGVSGRHRLCFVAMINSFALDYAARQKVGGINLNFFYVKQFPFFAPGEFDRVKAFSGDATMVDWISQRVLELVYTAHDLAPLAQECGYAGPPFAWDEARRFELRCELDAAFFHLYLPAAADGGWQPAAHEDPAALAALRQHFPTPRHAVAYILDQFPIVRQKDEQAHGHYRTQARILALYDAMLAAQVGGVAWRSESSPRQSPT